MIYVWCANFVHLDTEVSQNLSLASSILCCASQAIANAKLSKSEHFDVAIPLHFATNTFGPQSHSIANVKLKA